MELAAFRESQQLTQHAFAQELGLRSKGYLSAIERGREKCGIRLALKIEERSSGKVPALSLVEPDDAALLTGFANRNAACGRPDARPVGLR